MDPGLRRDDNIIENPREDPMKSTHILAGVGLAAVVAMPASAQLLNHKDLSLATALTIAARTRSRTASARPTRRAPSASRRANLSSASRTTRRPAPCT